MIKRIITFLFLLIALTALTLLITLIPEILGAELTSKKGQGFLLVVFGENYAWWLLLILVVAIAVLFFFTPEQIKGIFKREDKPIALTPEETQKNYDTICQYLRQRYERRKDQKLAGDQLFNLRIKPTTDGTSPEKAETFITLQGKKTGAEIQQIFEKARRRLLVTGLPGAGKTSLLLNLALELLETDHENLAVLLNLATWRSDFPSFDDWLREILPAELGVTKRYAAEILQKGQLTLLLDGLDEVDEAHQASCLEAIKVYGGYKHRDFVISCRKEEYKTIEKDAPVWAQIEVLPLTEKQLLTQLDCADRRDFPEAPDLKAALLHDPLLLKVAETPFYLNCLQLLFRGGSTLSELKLYTEPEIETISKIYAHHINKKIPVPKDLQIGQAALHLENNIVVRFVEQELAKPCKHGSSEKVRHWLAFLASRMTQRNKVVLELVDLQYGWWRWKSLNLLLPRFVEGFSVGTSNNLVMALVLTVAMIAFVFLSSSSSLIKKIIAPFTLAVFIYFGMLIVLGFLNITIWVLDVLQTLITKKRSTIFIETKDKNWKLKLPKKLSKFIFIPITVTLTAVVTYFINPSHFDIPNTNGSLWNAIIFFIVMWIVMSLEAFLDDSYSQGTYALQITTPYQRFTASAKALHFSILQHWLLRWQLYLAGVLPLRLVDFLHEMTARHLLETDGATWRFRHRILQEYFAGQWRE